MRCRLLSLLAALLALTPAPEAQPPDGSGGLLGIPLGTFYESDGSFLGELLALHDGRVLVRVASGIEVIGADGASLGEFNPALSGSRQLTQFRDGRVLISDGRDAIAFLPDGTHLGSFAQVPYAPDAIRQGIIDAVELVDGRVLLLQWYQEEDGDEAGRLFTFAADGTDLGPFTADEDAAYLFYPEAVKQLPDGRVIVAETTSTVAGPTVRGITAFDAATGERLAPFFEGSARDDLAVLPDGRILGAGLYGEAIPSEGPRVKAHVLAPDGTYLGPFAAIVGDLFVSNRLTVHPDGRVLVTEPSTGRVLAFGVVPVASDESPEASGVGAVFPQPLARGGGAGVEVTPEAPGEIAVRVFDALGRLVEESAVRASAGRQRLSVPVSGLALGVYVVRVEGAGLAASRRVVIAG